MPNSVTANRPITRNRVCTKPGTVHLSLKKWVPSGDVVGV